MMINNQKGFTQLRRELRLKATRSEQVLWEYLRGKHLNGFKFRRQHGIGRYIVDFYCPSAKLVVEVDGDVHLGSDSQAYDKERDQFFCVLGLTVLRFSNQQIERDCSQVLSAIRQAASPHS